jgi:hypothetical protein
MFQSYRLELSVTASGSKLVLIWILLELGVLESVKLAGS